MTIKLTDIRAIWPFFLIFACFALNAQTGDTKVHTVVIDAGHGGPKPGAVGRYYYEKDIALSVALRLGRIIEENFDDVNVILTRSNDYDVDLSERSNIANRAKADLFISIHCNGNEDKNVVGSETWVMGLHKSQENLEVAMRENSVIALEDNFESKYEGFDPTSPESYIIFSLMQNAYLAQSLRLATYIQEEFSSGPVKIDRGVKQAGFVVLYKTAAPSVLVELGFMSNINEELILGDPDNHQEFAERIFKAFKRYKEETDKNAIAVKKREDSVSSQRKSEIHENY